MKNTARIKLLLSLIVLTGCGKASGQVLQVNITTDPPTPPYPAATWIWFRCGVVTSLPVSYNWTTYCTSQGSNQVAFTLTNNNNTERYTMNVRSTPTICIDTVVCSAVDSVGNSGEAILRITNVTGAGLWGTSQPLSNNSALIADSAGQIGTIYCHSASQQPHIGRWTSPAGTDITFTSEDAFDVGLQSGSFHSYTTLTTNGFPLSVADQGVYSCQIPDENGIQNTLHIGIYPHGYASHLQILSVQKVPSPEPFIVINCSTTGLPPTRVYWTREGRELVNNQMYQLSQFPSDRVTSAYSNLLTINQTLQQLRGFYYCEVEGEQTGTNQSSFGPNVTQVQHSFGVYIVGYTESVTCVISSATRIEWLHNGSVVHSGPGPQQTLRLSVNDSIHHNLYTCRGYRNFTIFEGDNHTVIVNVPSTAIIISTSAESAPSLGQSLTIRCIVTETVDGLSARPVLQWQNHNGSDIVSGGGVILDGPNSQSTLTTLTLMFSALRTSHAGRYVCRGSLTSPALFSPLVKTEDYNISVQIPTPTVTILPPAVGTPYAGSRFILQCTIQLSQTVDSPVTFTVLWRRSGVLISNDTRTTVYNVAQNGSHTFLSMLVFSSLSLTLDSGQYTCEASVSASPPSPYITGSLSATSTAYSLTVERPTIVLASKSIGPTPTSTSPTPTPTAVVTPSPNGSSTLIVALTAGGGGTLFICVLVAVFVIMAGTQMRRKRRQEKERMTDIVVSVLKTDSSNCDEVPRIEILPAGSKEYGNSLASGKDPVTRVPSNYLHQMSRNMIIPSHCIHLMDCVGQGEFGVVYRAYLSGWEDESSQIVAVKTLKVISGLSDISELLDESLKMKTFSHPNILNLIGVCVDAGPAPYVVMPYMEKGSLLQYLKKERPHFTVAEGADSELGVLCGDFCGLLRGDLRGVDKLVSALLFIPLGDSLQNEYSGKEIPYSINFFANEVRTAGILAGMRPCGVIVLLGELFISESKTQVYGYLHNFFATHPDVAKCIEFICYDDACHLTKFAKNKKRDELTEQTRQLASVKMAVDEMHMKGHTDSWCKENCDPHKFPQLEKVVATQCKLLPMCLQIAKGMEYLANERFVHRDLATRNCMIDSSGVIKVADFGLSEDIYTKNYFQQGKKDAGVRLPIRWMALESLQDGIFSEKTDVWSFGVTCWEIFSLGRTPYPGVDPFSLVKFLEAGQRLEKPSNTACTDEIYSIILRCWCEVAEKRPSFSELVTVITTSLEAIAGYIDFSYLSVVNKEGHPYDHLAEQDEGT